MEKIVSFNPGYDKRHTDPNKNYGIAGVTIRFILKGKRGATQFVVFTDWYPPSVQREHFEKQLDHKYFDVRPMAVDLGYHARTPQYEGQKSMGPCEYLDGAECYYDGSGLNAEPVRNMLLMCGDEAVWKELERYYVDLFHVLE